MKKFIKATAAVLAVSALTAAGAYAAANTKEIKAYLNYDLKIKYDMQEQNLFDAEGNRVYPISYNGTTYLPVRAIGNLFDVNVDWDGDTYSVLLGKTGDEMNFIDSFKPAYSENKSIFLHHQSTADDYKSIEIGNDTYTGYISMYLSNYTTPKVIASYDLGGKYETLQFNVFSKCKKADSFSIIGDNDKVISKIDMKSGDVLRTVTVDVTGMTQIKFVTNADTESMHYVYIVNATIQ